MASSDTCSNNSVLKSAPDEWTGGLTLGNEDLPNCVPIPAADRGNHRGSRQAQELPSRFSLWMSASLGTAGCDGAGGMASFQMKNRYFSDTLSKLRDSIRHFDRKPVLVAAEVVWLSGANWWGFHPNSAGGHMEKEWAYSEIPVASVGLQWWPNW